MVVVTEFKLLRSIIIKKIIVDAIDTNEPQVGQLKIRKNKQF